MGTGSVGTSGGVGSRLGSRVVVLWYRGEAALGVGEHRWSGVSKGEALLAHELTHTRQADDRDVRAKEAEALAVESAYLSWIEPAGMSFAEEYALGATSLEDVYVRPEARGQGIGRAFLDRFLALARERNCARAEWSVLDWNENAIGLYQSLGAEVMPDWRICRVNL